MSESCENCVEINTILQLSNGKKAFKGTKFSFTIAQEKMYMTADSNRITAHACFHPKISS